MSDYYKNMPYYEDLIKLFEDWCKEYSCIIYFSGKDNLPEKILIDSINARDTVPLQKEYIKYLQDKLGENSVYGDYHTYCVEFDYYYAGEEYDYVMKGGIYV